MERRESCERVEAKAGRTWQGQEPYKNTNTASKSGLIWVLSDTEAPTKDWTGHRLDLSPLYICSGEHLGVHVDSLAMGVEDVSDMEYVACFLIHFPLAGVPPHRTMGEEERLSPDKI